MEIIKTCIINFAKDILNHECLIYI